MKVAFVIPSLTNNGPNVFTLNLVNSLIDSQLFINSEICVFFMNATNKEQLNFPVKTSKLNIRNTIKLLDFDIIHSTMFKADCLSALLRIFSSNKNKFIAGIHNEIEEDLAFIYGKYKGYFFSKIWLTALNLIGCIVVSSPQMNTYYDRKLSKNTYREVIPYGIKLRSEEEKVIPSESEALAKLRNNYTVIGTCGLLIERKNYELLIQFLSLNPDVCVVIVGDGPNKKNLLLLAIKYNVEDRLCILGFKSNSISYYKYFDIFALTSYSEGFGLAMLEALGQGIPTLLSDLPIYKDFFDESSVGLFDPYDIHSFEKAFNKIILSKEHYSNSALGTFKKYFSASEMANKHMSFYNRRVKKI
jgi:glycosyltransferase involved in cell wall biosynthesis